MKTALGYGKAAAGFVAGSGKAFSGPVSVFIEPTNICNLRCPLCASGAGTLDRPAGSMPLDDFKRIIDMLPDSVAELYLWGQGEPFLAADFLDMVAYASRKGYRTNVSTNGHFLEKPDAVIESGLDRLIISLDGADAETYNAYRVGGNFNRVTDGIRSLAEQKKITGAGPVIELQYLVTKNTRDGIPAFSELAASLGADKTVFKTLQADSFEGGKDFLPDDLNMTRYRRNADGEIETDMVWYLRNRCLRIYYSLQIDWQGNVLPCCFDKDSDHIMGNVMNEHITALWNGDRFRAFRRTLIEKGRIFPMCRDCTEGLKRKTMHG